MKEDTPIILHAEPEHDGIRITVLLALIVGLVLGFLLISQIIRLLNGGTMPDYILIVSCIGAIPIAFAIVWLIEQTLKRTWHSGITVALSQPGSVTLHTAQGEEKAVAVGNGFHQTNWFFSMKGYPRGGRERRVEKSWFCLACELQQDEEQLIFYTYAPAKAASRWTDDGATTPPFQQIYPPELYDTSIRGRMGPPTRPNIPPEVVRSANGRYWLAERRRWTEGLELSTEDFSTLLTFISSKQ
ncbi:MAG: hypothetical protein R3C62_16280 [Chloroflexota bacterium]